MFNLLNFKLNVVIVVIVVEIKESKNKKKTMEIAIINRETN